MKKVLALLICLCELSQSAVTVNNTNAMQSGTAGPLDVFMDVTVGCTNCLAVAAVMLDVNSGQSVTSVTYGGNAMTSAGTAAINSVSNGFVEMFYLVAPPTGTNHLVATISGTVNDIYLGLVAFQGVDQTTPVRPGTYQNSTGLAVADGSGNFSQVVTSDANDLTVSAIEVNADMSTNQTLAGKSLAGTEAAAHDRATTAAASVTHTWSALGAAAPVAMVSFSVQAVAAASSTVCPSVIGSNIICGDK